MTLPPGWLSPVALAPLEGIGHPAFLSLMDGRPGLGLIGLPFVSVGRRGVHQAGLKRQIPAKGGLRTPIALQLLGSEPDGMARAAALLADSGATVVDVNLGCPASKVVSRGAGAALLRDPEHVYRVVHAVRQVLPGPLSAKLRAGDTDTSRLAENLDAVQAAGVDSLVLHPRTRAQGYRGVSDWALLRRVRERVRVPLVGSGDAWYASDIGRMMKETGCDAVMVGRPAVRNPWIFEQAKALAEGAPPPRLSGEDLVAWLEEIAEAYDRWFPDPPRLATGKLKEIVRYVGSGVPDGGAFRRAALRAPDVARLLDVARDHLSSRSPDHLDLSPDGPYRLLRAGGQVPAPRLPPPG